MENNDELARKIVKRLKDIGRIEEKLKIILDDEIFDSLSKHNPYWHSEHELEGNRLDDARCKLGWINDQLWEIMAILKDMEDS